MIAIGDEPIKAGSTWKERKILDPFFPLDSEVNKQTNWEVRYEIRNQTSI
jgi:hypothetical protein